MIGVAVNRNHIIVAVAVKITTYKVVANAVAFRVIDGISHPFALAFSFAVFIFKNSQRHQGNLFANAGQFTKAAICADNTSNMRAMTNGIS